MFQAMGVPERGSGWRGRAQRWFVKRIDDPSYRIVVVEDAESIVACAMGAVRDAAPSPEVPYGRDVLVSNVCTRPIGTWTRLRGDRVCCRDGLSAYIRNRSRGTSGDGLG